MDYERAAVVLKGLLERQVLTPEEKEAVFTALGLLAWASLSKTRISQLKRKREEGRRESWGKAPEGTRGISHQQNEPKKNGL
jgi:hypothetical protein